MFTGIVEELGQVSRVEPRSNGVMLFIEASLVLEDLKPGSSVSIDGVCQTVLETTHRGFQVAAEEETLRVTNLGRLKTGHPVNLERALPAAGRLDGHVVLGHVDGCGEVVAHRESRRTHVLEIQVTGDLWPYIVPKGCVAIDGVSLTVGPEVNAGRFEVFIIPYTWEHTSLCHRSRGDDVNIETDILGRYVVQLFGDKLAGKTPGLTTESIEKVLGRGRVPNE